MSSFYVEFAFLDESRFNGLQIAFERIRQAKDKGDWEDDNYWLQYFDDAARECFWWPTQLEIEDWQRRWFSTAVEQRFTEPSLRTPWIFGSMIDAFRNGEYELLACQKMSDSVGRLEFLPHSYPYGGTDCMVALVESFGCRVLHIEE